jgi:flagellar basal body-associated protein FliL
MATTLCMGSVGFASDHGGDAHAEAEAEEEMDIPADVKTRGIDLGEFRIHSHYPVDAQKSTVRFVLYASVASERYAEMKRLIEAHEHRLRDQIITATRMTPLAVFDEPGLENFRRRMLLRLRRALPELAIDDVYVSEFQLTVKSL